MMFVHELFPDDLVDLIDKSILETYVLEEMRIYIREDVSGLTYVLVSPFRMNLCRNINVLQNKIISQAVEFFGYNRDYFREDFEDADRGFCKEEG